MESAIELRAYISHLSISKFGQFPQKAHFAGNRIVSNINILLQCEG